MIGKKEKEPREIKYQELINFFLPLAVMPIIIGIAHNAVNASLARLPFPEITLAVFAVSKSLTNNLKSPIHMARQTVTSLVDDHHSFKLVSSFLLSLGFLFFLIIAGLGYTSLGEIIFKRVIGLKDPQEIKFAYQALKIMAFIPLVETFRNMMQGLAISLKKTNLITPGVIVRIISISLILIWVTTEQVVGGMIAASGVWVIGITIEMIFVTLALRHSFGSFKAVIDSLPKNVSKKVNLKRIIKFFIPIAIMSFLTRFVQPVVQSGIVRTSIGPLDLAAYGVSWTLVLIFVGPLDMLHQCSLVYAHELNHRNWSKIKNFALTAGIIVSLILVILAFTQIGDFILLNIISVSPTIAELVQKVIAAFILFPIIRAYRETFWGVLMQRQTTNIIAAAKIVGLIFVIFVFLILAVALEINTAIIAALALTAGEAADALTISYFIKRNNTLNEIYADNKFN
jgi:Na+-driven multidrug efflux pump